MHDHLEPYRVSADLARLMGYRARQDDLNAWSRMLGVFVAHVESASDGWRDGFVPAERLISPRWRLPFGVNLRGIDRDVILVLAHIHAGERRRRLVLRVQPAKRTVTHVSPVPHADAPALQVPVRRAMAHYISSGGVDDPDDPLVRPWVALLAMDLQALVTMADHKGASGTVRLTALPTGIAQMERPLEWTRVGKGVAATGSLYPFGRFLVSAHSRTGVIEHFERLLDPE